MNIPLNSAEHEEMMRRFEKEYSYLRLDREKDKEQKIRGYLYENGEANELFKAFRFGYTVGRDVEAGL